MSKIIDFSKSVYELCKQDPEVIEIMKELGFEQISDGEMMDTVGRVMTIPKGAVVKGIDLEKIKDAFTKRGYSIVE